MRLVLSLALFLCLSLASSVYAANHYVLASAAGTASGADWTNAYITLPATLVRGDTYYIGDGSYVGYAFDDANSGSTLITIKKATVADHGTATGWLDTYGDGQATFSSQFVFTTENWVVDGITGGGIANQWVNNFGFKVTETNDALAVLSLGFSGHCDNITIRHVDVQGKGSGSANGGSFSNDGLAVYGCLNTTLSYFWMHGIGRAPVFASPSGEMMIEHGYVSSYFTNGIVHCEIMSIYPFWGDSRLGAAWAMGNVTVRYSLFTDVQSTGGIMWSNSYNQPIDFPSATLSIYGNVFYKPSGATWCGGTCLNGVIGGFTGANNESYRNVTVENNTFINIPSGTPALGGLPVRFSGNVAKNNIFYETAAPNYTVFGTHDYNHYVNSGTTQSESNGTSAGAGNIFSNYVGLNFSLTGATTAGVTLASPFNADMLGVTRGADGTWDRGAVDFVSGATPNAPTGLQIAAFRGSTFAVPIWSADTSGNWYGTNVYRCTVTGACSNLIATITAASAAAAHSPITQWIDNKLYTAATYYYTIAHFASNGFASATSSEVTITVTGKQ